LSLIAAAAGTPLLGAAEIRAEVKTWRWRGTALGALASLTIRHPEQAEAKRLTALALAELERLESIFSLYRPESAVSRLNRDGALAAPPHDLVRLLAEAARWSARTSGAFDVTVQPLWRLFAANFAAPGADPAGPPSAAVAAAREFVDWRGIEVAPGRIAFARPGMALTLNGIAQGYITDRVADLLHAEGLDQVLIDLGEIRALGEQPWRVEIADPRSPDARLDGLDLTNLALATSAALGTTLDPAGRIGHIFDSRGPQTRVGLLSASVVARQAADADALSTALVADARVLDLLPAMSGLGLEWVLVLDSAGEVRTLHLG